MRSDWNPMPHVLAVTCPGCTAEARFEFAEMVEIRLRQDVPYFQNSRDFEYLKVRSYGGGFANAAVYFHGLSRRALDVISDLPEGYNPAKWRHSRYLFRSHGSDMGAVICRNCDWRRKHVLSWPKDAYFQISYKSSVLWAFDREHALEILTFIGSEARTPSTFKFARSLQKLPAHFVSSKARVTVTNRLEALLRKG